MSATDFALDHGDLRLILPDQASSSDFIKRSLVVLRQPHLQQICDNPYVRNASQRSTLLAQISAHN